MKIFHINCNYIDTPLHQIMVKHLSKLGIDNTVFVPTCDLNRATYKFEDYVYAIKCFNKNDRFLFDFKQHKIINACEKNFSIADYDCIHAYTLYSDGNTARYLSQKYHLPYVVAIRSTDVNLFFKKLIHLRKRGVEILRDAKKIFFLSDTYKQTVIDQYVPEKLKNEILRKSYVISNGIDDMWLEDSPGAASQECLNRIKEKDLKLLYVGKLIPRKNVPMTLKAIESLQRQGYNISFTVIGSANNQKEYQEIISKPYVTYYPPKSQTELISIYRTHDIFIMPSLTESFGLTYAEAISQGLPVIYTKGQGFDGQFSEGEVGYHVDAHSVNSIASGITSVANNYESIRCNLPQKAKKFSWDSICRSYLQIYLSVVGNS